ncbi:MlaD family protein [Rhodococcus sp. X156]|uniref:MCE family protein n=1 Tax=Rhodococcus sp. X156 TaxID=2499145 RepID=UPI000FD7F8F8|nr:MlaD family protein [Rhodococcus sp. X156]
MILSRFVRMQLAIFAVLTVVGVTVMGLYYIQLPALVGVGRHTVTVQLPAAGGLYPFANVTYRGNTIGKVSAVRLTDTGVEAELSVDSGAEVPSDLDVAVKSVSAIGEQYVDLMPRTASGPFLQDGDVVPLGRATVPSEVGPLLDQANALVASIPPGNFRKVVDESFNAFSGSGPDLQRLLDSTRLFLQEAQNNIGPTRTLLEELGPLLDTQVVTSDAIRAWTSNLATFTDQVRSSDSDVRALLVKGQPFSREATALFQDLQPTLPILLANLTSVGQVAVTYNAALEQVLVIYPPLAAALVSVVLPSAGTGRANLDFVYALNTPPPCTTGYLPASERRLATEVDVPFTPDGLYCKIPQDAANGVAVRGVRNLPCAEVPGKRAPTPELCRDPEGYVPVGTNPGVTTPSQPVTAQSAAAPEVQPTPQSVTATAPYDPVTGKYVGSDGKTYAQADLAMGSTYRPGMTWQQLLTAPTGSEQ